MTPGKTQRLATAIGFLAGLLSCLDAVRDSKVSWPPDAVWAVLRAPQRLELGGGIALIVVSVVASLIRVQRS